MRSLALDPTTGDLALTAGRARLTEPGAETVAQRLRLRLALWRGEYVMDSAAGIPYLDLLARKGGRALLEATLRQAAATSPGVAALLSFSLDVDADRHATVSLAARATTGEVFEVAEFGVAA